MFWSSSLFSKEAKNEESPMQRETAPAPHRGPPQPVPGGAHSRGAMAAAGGASRAGGSARGGNAPEARAKPWPEGNYCQGSVHDKYEIGESLGKGSFAVVREALRKSDGQKFAIKIIEKNNPAFDAEALRKETAIMKLVDHQNCIKLHEVYHSPDQICLVLDLVTGGELFDRIIARGYYSEKDAAEVSRDVLQAVAYLHRIGIVHRDLKPENLLYMSNDETVPEYNQIKVADFGLARSKLPGSPMSTMCGTPGYVAPEVLDPRITGPSGYGPEVDVWSIGVVLYIMLCGFPPFYSDNTVTLFRQIRRGDFSFPSPFWDNISTAAKDLVCKMLVVNPRKRLTAAECLNHQWITNASKQETSNLGSQHKAFLLIRRLPLFEQVDPVCLSEVTRRLKRVTAHNGQYIIRAGEEGKCMYFIGSTPQNTIGSGMKLGEELARGIVRSKCLRVIVDGVEVTLLGTGDYFGEVALVSRADHKRTADVAAMCLCELFELSREDVYAVTQKFPILQARLQMMAEARLRRATSATSGSTTPLGGVAESSPENEDVGMRRHKGNSDEDGPLTKRVRRAGRPEQTAAAGGAWGGQAAASSVQWLRQPSQAYLEMPEALPRIAGVMRMPSRIGMMDHIETAVLRDGAASIDWKDFPPPLASEGAPADQVSGQLGVGGVRGVGGVGVPMPMGVGATLGMQMSNAVGGGGGVQVQVHGGVQNGGQRGAVMVGGHVGAGVQVQGVGPAHMRGTYMAAEMGLDRSSLPRQMMYAQQGAPAARGYAGPSAYQPPPIGYPNTDEGALGIKGFTGATAAQVPVAHGGMMLPQGVLPGGGLIGMQGVHAYGGGGMQVSGHPSPREGYGGGWMEGVPGGGAPVGDRRGVEQAKDGFRQDSQASAMLRMPSNGGPGMSLDARGENFDSCSLANLERQAQYLPNASFDGKEEDVPHGILPSDSFDLKSI